MKIIKCKDEAEFNEYNAKARIHLGIPFQQITEYATFEDSGLDFPVVPEVELIFPDAVEFIPPTEEEEE